MSEVVRRFGAWVAVAALGPLCGTAAGQTRIASNEPVDGRFAGKDPRKAEVHLWTVELAKDEGTVRLQVECKTTRVVAFLRREGQRTTTLLPVGDKGGQSHSDGVAGNDIVCQPDRPLAAGRYVIQVQPVRPGEAGPYRLRVLEPTFAAAAPAPGAPAAGGPGDEVARLRQELAAARKAITELEQRVERLERGAAGKP